MAKKNGTYDADQIPKLHFSHIGNFAFRDVESVNGQTGGQHCQSQGSHTHIVNLQSTSAQGLAPNQHQNCSNNGYTKSQKSDSRCSCQ